MTLPQIVLIKKEEDVGYYQKKYHGLSRSRMTAPTDESYEVVKVYRTPRLWPYDRSWKRAGSKRSRQWARVLVPLGDAHPKRSFAHWHASDDDHI